MCRFLLYIGSPVVLSDLITEPENSLIHQSFHSEEREEPLNGDGFGLAWYVSDLTDRPAVFRSISPAWNNRNLHHLARSTRSHCVLAHVRAASDDSIVSESNCHPFAWGPMSFMHNGDLAGFRSRRRELLQRLSDESYALIEGNTDSEYLFAYFIDRWKAAKATLSDPAECMAQALSQTIADMVQALEAVVDPDFSYLNLAVCDGERAVVSRFTTDQPHNAESLHIHTGKMYRCVDGACTLVSPTDGEGAVLVSSEKLSEDPGWKTVPANHLVIVHRDQSVQTRKL